MLYYTLKMIKIRGLCFFRCGFLFDGIRVSPVTDVLRNDRIKEETDSVCPFVSLWQNMARGGRILFRTSTFFAMFRWTITGWPPTFLSRAPRTPATMSACGHSSQVKFEVTGNQIEPGCWRAGSTIYSPRYWLAKTRTILRARNRARSRQLLQLSTEPSSRRRRSASSQAVSAW